MVTTSKQIQNYAFDSAHTLISTPDTFEFYDPKAQILSSFENTEEMNFLQLQGDIALVAGRNKGEIRLLRYENHPDTEVLAYDSSYLHDEARLSADGQTVTLFSYDQFRIYGVEGELIIDTQIPNAEQVYDQQFRRKGDDSWLEVIYYDGTVLRYDAANGKLLSKENGEKPDSSLYEEFYTDTLRIESPLHGPPVAYDRKTGRKIATLSTNAYLTYITQTANGLVAQYITAEGYFYGELLDDQCRVLATLPYLCDVVGERLIFDYPTGNVRESPIYPVDNLLQMAQDILNGSEKMS